MASFYWKGGSATKNWNDRLNWAIGSPTGQSGTGINDWPGYQSGYAGTSSGTGADVFIQTTATIVVNNTYLENLGSINIGGTGTTLIDFSFTNSHFSDILVYGNLTVKNCRTFQWRHTNPGAELFLVKQNTGFTTTIDTNGHVFDCSFSLRGVGGTYKLLSDFTINYNRRLQMYRPLQTSTYTINLNGYGLTVGQMELDGADSTNYPIFEFRPREDNDPIQQPPVAGSKNNLSYLYFTNLIGNLVNNTNYLGKPFGGLTPSLIDFVGIGQRPICVIGCAEEIKNDPTVPDNCTALSSDIGYGFKTYKSTNLLTYLSAEGNPTQDTINFNNAIDAFFTAYSKKIVDWYIIDEHPKQWASFRIVADRVHGTIDLTGNTPGDNVPLGPGCTKPVVVHSTFDVFVDQAFTGHVLLNLGQTVVVTNRSSNQAPTANSTSIQDMKEVFFVHKPRIRRNTIKGWQDLNPRLDAGEIGWEFDPANTGLQDKFKVGNGTSTWLSLQYGVKNTARGWATSTLRLASGQYGWECDTNKLKIGNSNRLWGDLNYIATTTDNPAIDYLGHPSYDQGLGDGWIIDFQNNSLLGTVALSSSYADTVAEVLDSGLSFISKKNTKLYLLSSIDARYMFVRGEDASSTIFLVGDSALVFVAAFLHLQGTISTVYGDGESSKIVTKLVDTTVWRSNHLAAEFGDVYSNIASVANFYGYYLRGGKLELYESNSIIIPPMYYQFSPSSTLFPGYFEVSNTGVISSIDFYFLTNNRSYTEGIIQTDCFNQVGQLNIRMYSDTGNLVTTSAADNSDHAVAITVTLRGFGQSKGTSRDRWPKYLVEIPSYRTGTVWRERSDLSVLSNSNITLKSYQYDEYYGLDSSGGLYAYLDENIMFPAGPLIVKVSGQYGVFEETRLIVAQSSSTYFIIDTTTGGPVAFYSGYDTISLSNIIPKIAGLDLTLNLGDLTDNNTLHFWNQTQLYDASTYQNFYVTNDQGGHIFSRDTIIFPRYLLTFILDGGSENLPARVDVQELKSGLNSPVNIDIVGGYYTIGGNAVSTGVLNLSKGTLDQTRNDLLSSPTFAYVNLDNSTSARTFIHGHLDSVGNPVAFYITGQSGVLWRSGGTGLTITTLYSALNEQYAPSVIDFKAESLTADIYIYPGNLSNFSAPMTPDQSALTFSFNQSLNGTSSNIYIRNDLTNAMCVQTLLLGYYEDGSWTGWRGTIRINRDLVFCGNFDVYNNNSPFADVTIYNYLGIIQDQDGFEFTFNGEGYGNGMWNRSNQYGGLNLGPNNITAENNAQLFFQGQGEVVFGNPTVPSTMPVINFGSATYKNVIQYSLYNPSIGQTYDKNYFVTPWTVISHPIITNYNIRGHYGNINVVSGQAVFDYLRVNTTDYSNTVTVFSLLASGTNLTINSATVQLYGIDLRIFNTLTTYNNTKTSFVAIAPSSLSFANTNQFNANLNQYLNISIGTWRQSLASPVPVLTINPCASDTDGSPLIDEPSSVTLGNLKASGVGPSVFQFTPGTTSTFIDFTYTDTSAPFNTTASWYSYANTLSNTVLRSSQPAQSWNISIPTPHRGTIREKHAVSNLTIQDSNAIQEYIWFAPGTVNVGNTGTAYREGYVSGSQIIRGASINYYNYNAGGNTGWVFHEPPSASMDLSFWPNTPWEVLLESTSSYYYNTFFGQSWSSTNFVTPGSYTWIVPQGIYSIAVTVIGGGGGGGRGSTAHTGGGGGGLRWATNIPVVPGDSYAVVVGAGGAVNTDGGTSSFSSSSLDIRATGGQAGNSAPIDTVTLLGGRGGFSSVLILPGIITGSGDGGNGGTYTAANSGQFGLHTGGGGAGGYNGVGGLGQDNSAFFGVTNQGQGGGAAGGAVTTSTGTRGGGGTNPYGEGVSGLAPNRGGSGGSSTNTQAGGRYGGGGGGASSGNVGTGGDGAVRISWPGFFGPK